MMLEDEFEVGSVFNAGSKKQNINHLLNFQFEPRGSQANKKSANNTKHECSLVLTREQFLTEDTAPNR